MAETDALKKYLDAGMAFTQLTRSRAERVVKDLVTAGEIQRHQAKAAIDDLVEMTRKNAELLAEQVRSEVDSQLANMGLARKADIERLEAEVARLRAGADPAGTPPPKAPSARKPAVAATPTVLTPKPEKKATPVKATPVKAAPTKAAPTKKAAPAKASAAPKTTGPAKKAAKAAKKQG